MKKIYMKLIKTCIVACILVFSTGLKAQTNRPQLDVELRKQILLLEKRIFEIDSDSVRNELLIEKGILLKQHGLIGGARYAFSRIPKTANEDQIYKAYYNLALLDYALNQFESAGRVLNDLSYYASEHFNKPEVLFLTVLVSNVMLDFDYAKKRLNTYADSCNCDINIDSLYSFADEMKDPLVASRRSAFLPGLGQVYAGEPWKGLNSFMLNAACLGYATWCAYNKMYLNGIFTGISLFAAFYSGGKRNAASIVENKNAGTISNLNKYLIDWSENCM